MSLESDLHATSSRKALKVAVSALCSEVGFEKAEESVIETLIEMLQSCKFTRFFHRNVSKNIYLSILLEEGWNTAISEKVQNIQIIKFPSF